MNGCLRGKKDKGIHTNEQDGEGDEEKKNMRDEVEGVHEAAIVQDSIVHTVGIFPSVVPTERQGHVTWLSWRSLGMVTKACMLDLNI